MKLLEKFEAKKGNKLIFRQSISEIPSLGATVVLKKTKTVESPDTKKQTQIIGSIIDVFGPVKTPWVVVNLKNEIDINTEHSAFYWDKPEKFVKKKGKNEKFYKKGPKSKKTFSKSKHNEKKRKKRE